MSTTINLLLLFAVTNSYCQNNEVVKKNVGRAKITTAADFNSEPKTITYAYLGSTMQIVCDGE